MKTSAQPKPCKLLTYRFEGGKMLAKSTKYSMASKFIEQYQRGKMLAKSDVRRPLASICNYMIL